jgi:hypothetical protein
MINRGESMKPILAVALVGLLCGTALAGDPKSEFDKAVRLKAFRQSTISWSLELGTIIGDAFKGKQSVRQVFRVAIYAAVLAESTVEYGLFGTETAYSAYHNRMSRP